ncbi:Multidrug_MFS transporter [Hexamita inflata]|uniref:Multidrug MFS transporter n=1 Tax=Hexamita inflata TaxID=28002 RepID=A0AA86NS32_9EUKA|nr:Multidrug MFS transporter [Hexamita inflata]
MDSQSTVSEARLKFKQELKDLPKMSPTKLIWLVGWSLCMSSLDSTIVNIANPNIQRDSNFVPKGQMIPTNLIQWINDLYSISFAAFAIPAAKISDRIGVTLANRIGVVGFVIFSTLCGASRFISYKNTWQYGGFYVLLAARLMQGVFGAVNMATTMTLCGILVEQKDIPRSLANNSLAFAVATALGPVVGGVITQYLGWEYCFFINIIFGGISFTLCWLYIPKTPKLIEEKFDYLGGFIVMTALIVLILGLTYIPPKLVDGILSYKTLILGICLAIGGVALIIFFVWWELRHPFAMLPRGILTCKKIVLSLIASLFNFAMMTATMFQMPFVYQTLRCYSPTESGFINLVTPVAQVCASLMTAFLAKKVCSLWTKITTSIFSICLVIGLGFVIKSPLYAIILVMVFYSFSLGVYFSSNGMFMMQTATPDIRGMLGGTVQSFRETGLAIGIAIVNLSNELFIGNKRPSKPVIDSTCSSIEFIEYRNVLYDALTNTNLVMSGMGVLSLVFAIMSGFNVHEKDFIGYPKKEKGKEYDVLQADVEQYV